MGVGFLFSQCTRTKALKVGLTALYEITIDPGARKSQDGLQACLERPWLAFIGAAVNSLRRRQHGGPAI
jgi:hypothetical protein